MKKNTNRNAMKNVLNLVSSTEISDFPINLRH